MASNKNFVIGLVLMMVIGQKIESSDRDHLFGTANTSLNSKNNTKIIDPTKKIDPFLNLNEPFLVEDSSLNLNEKFSVEEFKKRIRDSVKAGRRAGGVISPAPVPEDISNDRNFDDNSN